MKPVINDLLRELAELQTQLQEELHAQSDKLAFNFEQGRLEITQELRRRNREFKTGLLRYIRQARLPVVITAPAIYMLIVPFVLLDLMVSVYQLICFPVYKITPVPRRDFLVFDRVKLNYLNGIEKLNCAYCTYCNGIIAYVREVAARTEQYWCPIKHARSVPGTHERYPRFTDYGDGAQFRKEESKLKVNLQQDTPPHNPKV